MPQTNSGLYKVILEQTYQNKSIFNVFAYIHSLGQDDQQDLCAQAFDEDVMSPMSIMQSINLTYDTIRCVNITGALADDVITPTESAGDVIGADAASFISCSFRYNRETKDTRNGSKRLAGMVEENMVGVGFEAPFFSNMGVFAIVLGADISTVGGVFTPIILGKETLTPGTWLYNSLVSVQALNRQTSQVSRKVF